MPLNGDARLLHQRHEVLLFFQTPFILKVQLSVYVLRYLHQHFLKLVVLVFYLLALPLKSCLNFQGLLTVIINQTLSLFIPGLPFNLQ